MRQQLTDYLGSGSSNVELVCTENNSVSYNPGKQTTSLVNGLFLADSVAQCLQTEFKALVWWDLRNGADATHNNGPYLYGWRQYGDYGLVEGAAGKYPTYYTGKLLKYFARPGDQIISASSGNSAALAAYAARRPDGSVALLLINKEPTTPVQAELSFTNFAPNAQYYSYSYGIPQDEAARTGQGAPDLSQTQSSGAATAFTWMAAPYSATVLWLQPSGPRLVFEAAPPGGEGGIQLGLQGVPGVVYEIESSLDLTNWTTVSTNSAASGQITIELPPPLPGRDRFYRAMWRQ